MPPELRFRQVHLDFHTSEHIPGIGADFDPDRFAERLTRARVNSVTCFARGHHGWMYYPTRRFPERIHPHLERANLLGEQIAACHARDIRVPIYITVQWDHDSAERNPEWLALDEHGAPCGDHPYNAFAPGFYRFLCVNTAYAEFLKENVSDVCEVLGPEAVDGFFFDIVKPVPCACRACREEMLAEGLDPTDAAVREQFGRRMIGRFMREMSDHVRARVPEATIFYNSSHITPLHRRWLDAFTHLELESLPSGGWGYTHFPLTQRYARGLGVETMGMTGKFHTSWGDFQSFKNPAALQFECFQMLSLGAGCSIGDQLHPRGELCEATYELIGEVYREVEAAEPWSRDAEPVSDVGVLYPAQAQTRYAGGSLTLPDALIGAVRMLQETHRQFDIIDAEADLEGYRAVILPDAVRVDEALRATLEAYLDAGGRLVASHRSGLDPDGGQFALRALGVKRVGEAPYSPDFLAPTDPDLAHGLRDAPHVMYLRAMQVTPAMDARVLANTHVPYFNRTWRHFCSHKHTPSSGDVGYPAVVQRGRCIYFAHPIFAQYAANAPRWVKTLLENALDRLIPDPAVRTDGPSSMLATLNVQPAHRRRVLHLLHYIPERRGQAFDVIEDVLPLHDVAISLRADGEVSSVRTVPDGGKLPFEVADGRIGFTLPLLTGRQMIEIA